MQRLVAAAAVEAALVFVVEVVVEEDNHCVQAVFPLACLTARSYVVEVEGIPAGMPQKLGVGHIVVEVADDVVVVFGEVGLRMPVRRLRIVLPLRRVP